MNIKQKIKDSKNIYYFDKIDTEAKAYYLGLLYADGHNSINSNKVTITLKESDKRILDKFMLEIFGKNSIKRLSYINNSKKKAKINGRSIHGQNQWTLNICSSYMSRKLLEYGMTPRKSFTLEFPTCVPKHLIHHFIRGFYDGDGSISTMNGKNFEFNIIGPPRFIKHINGIIKDYLDFDMCFQLKNSFSQPMAYTRMNGNRKIFKLLSWLYQDATFFLNRKHKIFLQIKNYVNDIKYKKRSSLTRNTSKYIHVYRRPDRDNKWHTCYYLKGKSLDLGRFDTEFNAYIAVCEFEIANKLEFSNNPKEYFAQV